MNTLTLTPGAEDLAMKEAEPYLQQFEGLERNAVSHHPAWVFPLRKAGISRFAELGLPSLKHEDWRYTNLAPLRNLPFRPVFSRESGGVNLSTWGGLPFAAASGCRLVFVDGHYAPALSRVSALPDGVRVESLAAALASDGHLLEQHLGRLVLGGDNAFAALNTAFFSDGAFIHVPAGQALEEPIHLTFLSTGREAGATSHPRNLILADRESRVTIIESYLGVDAAAYVTNSVTELVAGDGAAVEHARFQDEAPRACHLGALYAQLGRHSRLTFHSLALGARLSRQTINTVLGGEGVECVLNGLYLGHADQLVDHHMIVDHAQPHCTSHEYFNGILTGRSQGVFHGRILVRKDAQKTDAKQTNKNLLLSDEATIDTKPQLEIYADDVKCTHGATVGQLNPESIFYLRARGLGLDTARRMLVHAFAGEILERIQNACVREELDKLVWDRLERHGL